MGKFLSISSIALSLWCAAGSLAQCGTYCLADTNQDGMVTPTDFNAWIGLYNNNDPRADVNQDGMVTPSDYNAWIAEYNKGPNGTCCPGPIYIIAPCTGGAPIFTKTDLSSCLGRFIQYNSNDRGLVSKYSDEVTVDDSLIQSIGSFTCVDGCEDNPVTGTDEFDSSIVVLLGAKCETVSDFGDCVIYTEGYAVSDAARPVRLYETSPGSKVWQGISDGFTVTASYDDSTAGMSLPYHERWVVSGSSGAWPDNSCANDCINNRAIPGDTNITPPSGSQSYQGTHGAYQFPTLESLTDCTAYNAPGVEGHYATIQWILLTDFDGSELARNWHVELVVCQ